MIWKPHATVAALIECDGRFLMVEEHADGGLRLNQPAGHLEESETLAQAAVREVFEESGHRFVPEHLVGLYQWRHAESGREYLRAAFSGRSTGHEPDAPLDTGIVRALWMSADEIRAARDSLRSPLVLACLEDYLAGQRFPLSLTRRIS